MNHKNIINNLERRLKRMDCHVNKCVEYNISLGHGECDLFGINKKHKTLFIFEVKRTDKISHREKAEHQLFKDNILIDEGFCELAHYKRINMYAFTDLNKRKGYNVQKVKPTY